MEKQAERWACTDRGKISDRRTVRLTRTDRQTTYTDRRTERQTKRQNDRKTDRKTDRQTQTDRQIDRQTWQTALVFLLAKFLFQIVSGLLQKWQDVSENGRSYWSPSVGGQRVNSTGRVSWWTEALINSYTTCLALEFSSLNLCNLFEKRSNLTKTWVSMCFSSGILPEFQS